MIRWLLVCCRTMDKMKTKVIGVLKEREDKIHSAQPGGSNTITTTTAAATTTTAASSRQLPTKVSALDISGILNCRRRLEWTKEWLKKYQHEFLNKENLRKELLFRSNEVYHLNCFFNITEKQFRHLVNILEPLVTVLEPQRKKKTFSAEERIAITLKYLATGEVNSCRNYCFRASKPVIVKMIADICQKMYELLKDQYVCLPKTEDQWRAIANGMEKSFHISNCLGNIIMRQIAFYTPPNQPVRPRALQLDDEEDKSCSQKPPLVLSTIVDGDYNFLYVDVEKTKAQFNNEIYEKSKICKIIEDGTLAVPKTVTTTANQVENCDINPYYFVGSMSLPAKPYLLSLSQLPADSNLDNSYSYSPDSNDGETNDTLCILCNMFPVLGQPLRLCEIDAEKIIMGSIALYNYLRKSDSDYCKLTDKIIVRGKEGDMADDEDCILIDNEEEQSEHAEFTPNVCASTCFRSLHKQRNLNPAAAGLANVGKLPK